MRENSAGITKPDLKGFSVDYSWRHFGVTKHLGGVYATDRLIKMCAITPGQYVLDIGCGTGYTACLLTKKHHARVVASDINLGLLEEAKRRISREGLTDGIMIKEADVQELPFPDDTFDAVIAESVLVFCDKVKAASEIRRTLKTGGVFGDNEGTYRRPPPPELAELMAQASQTSGGVMLEDEWRAVYQEAGFKDTLSAVYSLNSKEEFVSALRVNGLRFIASNVKAMFDPTVRGALLSRSSYGAIRKTYSYMGYGLYVSRKD